MQSRTVLAKRNGHSPTPPLLVEYVPDPLRKQIEQVFEEEGLMQETAERRILEVLNANHKETQTSISDLKDTLHDHDKRVTLVEKDVKELKDVAADIDTLKKVADDVDGLKTAAKDAADERRNTSRLVKAAIVGSVMSIVIGALVSVYGTRAPVVQEVKEAKQDAKQDTAELTTQLKELIEVLKLKTEQAPAKTAAPKGQTRRSPGPGPGPGASLREGELIAPRDHLPPIIGSNRILLPQMKVPQ